MINDKKTVSERFIYMFNIMKDTFNTHITQLSPLTLLPSGCFFVIPHAHTSYRTDDTQSDFYIILPKARLLHMMRILDIFSPYNTGLKSGWHASQYNDKKMRNMFGTLLILNRPCTISKKAPKVKLSREAR